MSTYSSDWIRVSHSSPCPICDGPDNCTVTADHSLVYCGRIEAGSLRQNAGGQFLHRHPDAPVGYSGGKSYSTARLLTGRLDFFDDFVHAAATATTKPAPPPAPKPAPPDLHSLISPQSDQHLSILASNLGVSPDSLRALGTYFSYSPGGYATPERDCDGELVGIAYRSLSGSKWFAKGGSRGLTYADDWTNDRWGDTGPILITEGMSDVAAGIDLGFSIIGRANNTWVKGIAALIEEAGQSHREILIVAERDEKPDGRWPGRDGALQLQQALIFAGIERVSVILPPAPCKDLRVFRLKMQEQELDYAGSYFLSKAELVVPQTSDELSQSAERGHKSYCRCDLCCSDLAAEIDDRKQRQSCSFVRPIYSEAEQHVVMMRMDCRSCNCSKCRPKIAKRYIAHAQQVFLEGLPKRRIGSATFPAFDPPSVIYRTRISAYTPQAKNKLSSWSRKTGEGCLRVVDDPLPLLEHPQSIIYSSQPLGDGFPGVSSSVALSPAEALACFTTDVLDSQYDYKFLYPNDQWKLPSKPEKRNTDWRAVKGSGWQSPEAIRRACEYLQLDYWLQSHQADSTEPAMPASMSYTFDDFSELHHQADGDSPNDKRSVCIGQIYNIDPYCLCILSAKVAEFAESYKPEDDMSSGEYKAHHQSIEAPPYTGDAPQLCFEWATPCGLSP